MKFPVGDAPKLYLKITDKGEDVGYMFTRFEWKAFTNGGHIIKATLQDSYWNKLKKIATDFYLKDGANKPTKITFELSWPGITGDNERTGKMLAIMTELDARGVESSGRLGFMAVDPPTYFLNAGDSSGKAYTGKVSSVINQVLNEYYVQPAQINGITGDIKVSDTTDFEQNRWYMMRQDPKTFIGSLIDWSSRLTSKETNWIVSTDCSMDDGCTIWIKEQADRDPKNYGAFSMNYKTPAGNTIYNFELLSDTYLTTFNNQLITHGISAVSEKYLDRKSCAGTTSTDMPLHNGEDSICVVHVHDSNTPAKLKPSIGKEQGFRKPTNPPGTSEFQPHEWSTSIPSIPEDSAMNIGKTYDKYIDGIARQTYLNMLPLIMRIKIRCTGIAIKDLINAHNLGVSKLKILWLDADGNDYFLGGNWLVYGFHHILTRGHWYTDIYCYRIYHDSTAKPV